MEFNIGTKLSHTKYGAGKIIDTDKNTVLINFPDTNETRRFLKKSAAKHSIFTILTKAPGLYDKDDNLVADWDELIKTKRINIEENTLIICDESIKGKLIIDDSVTIIGEFAFRYCTSLTSVTIPDSVTSIGYEAFNCCESLTNITIPDSVTSIGYEAFNCCESLTNITIPNSVTNIGYFAFSHCTSLTSIAIPNSVTSIGDYAFGYCASLTNVTLPDDVTSIGRYAFYGCASLKSITIPDSVTSIGECAFYDCKKLKNIHFNGAKSEWNTIDIDSVAFKYCPTITVHCTDEYLTINN